MGFFIPFLFDFFYFYIYNIFYNLLIIAYIKKGGDINGDI